MIRRILRRRHSHSTPHPAGTDLAPVPAADRFRFSDLLAEATADIGARPGRLIMTLAGTVLGIAALVATIGLAHTAASQIARQFDAAAATQLTVTPAKAETRDGTSVATATLPWDTTARMERLAGVEAAALIGEVTRENASIRAVPVNDPAAVAAAPPRLYAASAEILDTIGASITTGRSFDNGHDTRADRVALLGERAAEQLGI
ncbi:ABC transporter permease, partial [Microbacterium sp. VKM Ac-2923]|uniref:ABC transporter permease n=1 Tax=Microbacterium sp. VKM Ac-2923 TaxID=2929476 RepID=UPI001FB3CFE3